MEAALAQHVRLLAGHRADGQPVVEEVPARASADGTWALLATPGLAIGCAAGDRLSVAPDGTFRVEERGGNVAVLSYGSAAGLPEAAVLELREDFEALGATVEAPPDGRFVTVTVPVTVGFPAIESRMQRWMESTGLSWHFGNVYSEDDTPLNWWADGA